ncbi:MAG TPA: hypothetical protein VN726_07220, partial [Hanamia sp.]|nr:hypothetical protein [Hanamia sp.]
DRPGAAIFYNALKQMLGPAFNKTIKDIPIIKTIASAKGGIPELYQKIREWKFHMNPEQKVNLVAEKVWSFIETQKMKDINKDQLRTEILNEITDPGFNLYRFAKRYFI